MSDMIKRNQYGMINSLLPPLIIALTLLLAAIAFGSWAYTGRQSYKTNVDARVSAAVAVGKQQQLATDDAQFATEEKSPLQTYYGPEAYGSLVIKYPKSWSGYVDSTGNGSALVDAYFSPGTVPSISSSTSIFALRVQVQNQSYSSVAQNIVSQEQSGTLTAKPYALPKLPKEVGLEVVGQLPDGNKGTEIVLPLRSETLVIWTEGNDFLSDFNTYVLPNFSFSP
jgi:hypothetical protein